MPDQQEIERQFLAYRSQRQRVAIVASACLLAGGVGWCSSPSGTFWPAACLRIGFVFSSLWICFPSRRRPAAWAVISPLPLIIIAATAFFLPRVKGALPLVAVAAVALLILRPRRIR